MNNEVNLTRQDWHKVETIARELAAAGVDRNEVGKVVAYLQRRHHRQNFMSLLDRLPHSNYIRSNQTRNYFERIRRVCRQHLQDITDDRQAVAILAWAFRLMTYYSARKVDS